MSDISVLVIDDHPLFREGVRNVIEAEEGMRVVGEGMRGDEGLDLVRKFRPTVALIDGNLPTMNGIQVTRLIAAERPGAPAAGRAAPARTATAMARPLLRSRRARWRSCSMSPAG